MVVHAHAVDHRLVRRGLQRRVDGGGDVVALVQHVLAVTGNHLLAHHFRHVRRIDLDLALVRGGVHRHGLGGFGLGGADIAELGHARQDVVVATFAVAFRVVQRIAAGRELRRASQGGGLVQGEFAELLAVVELRRRGHAVGAIAEEALVEVQAEDLVLAEFALHLHRQQHLAQLAGVAVLAVEEVLACHLLGDGGAARHALVVGGGQQPDRARHALVVDAVVLVEAGVLGGQEGLPDPQRHVLDVDRIAAHFAEQAHQLAVAGVDVHRFLQLGGAQGLHVRQARRDRHDQDRGGDRAEHGKRDAAQQNEAQGAGEAGHRRRFRLRVSWSRSIE